ncbi:MAG: RsmB/NOP family class I SAM-dependent RNA methyltransferase, partial [Sphingobacteriales bacterium]
DIENILNIDNEVVVQDMSSQRVGEIMREIHDSLPKQADVWDACAASGGKTILLYDIQPTINLLASDIRDSILDNLKKRLAIAGLHNYQAIVADLRKAAPSIKPQDLIMADVPCTGSGTWGRTPENLLFISEQQLENYVQLQRKILDNTIPLVKEGGHFLYMT